MAWLDDRIRDHPKIVGLSDRAFRSWAYTLTYCSEHGTQGRLDAAVIALRIPKQTVQEIVRAGLWDEEHDGLWAHDWQEYNGKRDDALAQRREADRRRAKAHRDRVRATRTTHASRDATPERDVTRHVTDAPQSRDESRDGHVTDTRGGAPAPTRAPAGARPNDHYQDHVLQPPAAPTSDSDPAAAADEPDLDELRAAGWTPRQLNTLHDHNAIARARALLAEARADTSVAKPAALAWEKYQAGAQAGNNRATPTVAAGATGERSTRTKGPHLCPNCPTDFQTATALADHVRNIHTDPEHIPPPPELAALINGRALEPNLDDEPADTNSRAPITPRKEPS